MAELKQGFIAVGYDPDTYLGWVVSDAVFDNEQEASEWLADADARPEVSFIIKVDLPDVSGLDGKRKSVFKVIDVSTGDNSVSNLS